MLLLLISRALAMCSENNAYTSSRALLHLVTGMGVSDLVVNMVVTSILIEIMNFSYSVFCAKVYRNFEVVGKHDHLNVFVF